MAFDLYTQRSRTRSASTTSWDSQGFRELRSFAPSAYDDSSEGTSPTAAVFDHSSPASICMSSDTSIEQSEASDLKPDEPLLPHEHIARYKAKMNALASVRGWRVPGDDGNANPAASPFEPLPADYRAEELRPSTNPAPLSVKPKAPKFAQQAEHQLGSVISPTEPLPPPISTRPEKRPGFFGRIRAKRIKTNARIIPNTLRKAPQPPPTPLTSPSGSIRSPLTPNCFLCASAPSLPSSGHDFEDEDSGRSVTKVSSPVPGSFRNGIVLERNPLTWKKRRQEARREREREEFKLMIKRLDESQIDLNDGESTSPTTLNAQM